MAACTTYIKYKRNFKTVSSQNIMHYITERHLHYSAFHYTPIVFSINKDDSVCFVWGNYWY